MKYRRFTSTVIGILIIFTAFTVMNTTNMNVLAGGNGVHNWYGDVYIQENKTYPEAGNDSAIITLWDGDLIICDGYTLTLNDNVTLRMYNTDEDPGYYKIQIN